MGRIPKATVHAIMKDHTNKALQDTSLVLVVDYIEKIVVELTKTSDRISTLNRRNSISPSDIVLSIEQLEQRRGNL